MFLQGKTIATNFKWFPLPRHSGDSHLGNAQLYSLHLPLVNLAKNSFVCMCKKYKGRDIIESEWRAQAILLDLWDIPMNGEIWEREGQTQTLVKQHPTKKSHSSHRVISGFLSHKFSKLTQKKCTQVRRENWRHKSYFTMCFCKHYLLPTTMNSLFHSQLSRD